MTSRTTQPKASATAARCQDDRALATDQAASHDQAERMERMIDGPHQPIAPGPAIELLGLADVPQAVGEAGLRMPERPAQEEGRAEHQKADPSRMLVEGHEGLSMAGKSPHARSVLFRPT